MSDPVARRVGDRLRSLRVKQDLSQVMVADRAEMNRAHLSDVENGYHDVSVSVLDRLCRVLGVTLEEFFEDFDL